MNIYIAFDKDTKEKGVVEFKNVSFSYDKGKKILNNINIDAVFDDIAIQLMDAFDTYGEPEPTKTSVKLSQTNQDKKAQKKGTKRLYWRNVTLLCL